MKRNCFGKKLLVTPVIFFGLWGFFSLDASQKVYANEIDTKPQQEILSETVESSSELVEETISPEGTGSINQAGDTESSIVENTEDSSNNPTEETPSENTSDSTATSEETTNTESSDVSKDSESTNNSTEETASSIDPIETSTTDSQSSVSPTTSSSTKKTEVPKIAAAKATTKATTAAKTQPTIAIYRVYNPNSGEHLHTMNSNEKDFLVRLGWRYEGISMRVSLTGRQLFRIYNPNSGEHFFTLEAKERDNLKRKGWRYEGIAWHTPWAGMPMYRVYNPNTRGAGAHHYTMLLSERNHLIKVGWRNEGISWYTLGGAQPIAPVQRTLAVPYVSQYIPVFSPWGCAGASMTMLLRYKGKNVDLKYVQNHLPMYPNDKGGQKGNVYTGEGFGWVITPGSLANYAKKWYGNVSNITGTNTQAIVNRIIGGNPVLYYGYSSYQKDSIRNHCKVIVGYKDNKFLVHDPLYFNSSAKAGAGGPNKTYDRGAIAWVSISDFNKEWDGRAVGIS